MEVLALEKRLIKRSECPFSHKEKDCEVKGFQIKLPVKGKVKCV